MKTNCMQKEILVMLNSAFAQEQFNKIDKKISEPEKLEEACVNCLLQQLLPVIHTPSQEQQIYLWQIHPGISCLQFELGELPVKVDKVYSIDPHNFLDTYCYN